MHKKLCALKGLLRAVSRLEESIRDAYGVTLTEALCLCSVSGGCATAGNLGEEINLSPSRLSRLLASLEKKRLLERTRRNDDKRSWDVVLTETGAVLIARMQADEIELPEELRILGND